MEILNFEESNAVIHLAMRLAQRDSGIIHLRRQMFTLLNLQIGPSSAAMCISTPLGAPGHRLLSDAAVARDARLSFWLVG
jgi:hypothetical protein